MQKTPKSWLLEFHASQFRENAHKNKPDFQVEEVGPQHFVCQLNFPLLGQGGQVSWHKAEGSGKNKKQAEQNASQNAQRQLSEWLKQQTTVVGQFLQEQQRNVNADGVIQCGIQNNGNNEGQNSAVQASGIDEQEILIKNKDGKFLVLSARDYQMQLYHQALKDNMMVFMETGTGKTLVAVLLIRTILSQQQSEDKLAIFLAPKKALVQQQFKVLETGLPFKVQKYTGDDLVDSWDIFKWQQEQRVNKVLVMTPQILVDCLKHAFIRMKDLAVIVFDEVHNARGKSPYSVLLTDFYVNTGEDERPRILGLSASPIGSKNDVPKSIAELVELTQCKVATIPPSASRHGTKAEVREAKYTKPETNQAVAELFEEAMQLIDEVNKQMKDVIRKATKQEEGYEVWKNETRTCSYILAVKKHLNAVQHCLEQTGPIGALICCQAALTQKDHQTSLQRFYQALVISERNGGKAVPNFLVKQVKMQLERPEEVKHCVKRVYILLVNAVITAMEGESVEVLNEYMGNDDSDYKEVKFELLKLVENVMKKLGLDAEQWRLRPGYLEALECSDPVEENISSSQVLQNGLEAQSFNTNKYEVLIKILLYITQNLSDQELKEWRCLIFVQQKSMALTLKRLLQIDRRVERFTFCFLTGQSEFSKATKESLSQFRNGECNVMVCTSVVEEGIDISQCKLVIRFDIPPTVASNIQSKGRARADQATYVIMYEEGNQKHLQKMQKLKAGEQELKDTLQKHNEQSDQEEEEQLSDYEDDTNDILEDDGSDDSEELDNFKIEPDQVLSVPATGAYLSESQALQTVYQYCAALPHDQYTISRPTNAYKERYVKMGSGGEELLVRQYRITMPLNCPISDPVYGPFDPNQKIAKRKAAIRVCKQLHRLKELDDNLIPQQYQQRMQQRWQEMQDMLESDDDSFSDEEDEDGTGGRRKRYGIKSYKGQVSIQPKRVADSFTWPEFQPDWGIQHLLSLNLYLLQPKKFKNVWGMLTIKFLPHVDNNQDYQFCGSLEVNSSQLEALLSQHLLLVDLFKFKGKIWCSHRYDLFFQNHQQHLQILMGNGVQREDGEEMFTSAWYLLLPCLQFYASCFAQLGGVCVEGLLERAVQFQTYMHTCSRGNLEDPQTPVNKGNIVEGCVIYHTHTNQMYRYIKQSTQKLGSTYENSTYWEFFNAKYPEELQRYTMHDNLLEVYLGGPTGRAMSGSSDRFCDMLPSVLRVYPLHKDMWSLSSGLNECLWNLENNLIVYDASVKVNQLMNGQQHQHEIRIPKQVLFQEALTAKRVSKNINYEKLETLGDAALKFLVSQELYFKHPQAHEGKLTSWRTDVVCNKTLFECAQKNMLTWYIRLLTQQDIGWGPSGSKHLQQRQSPYLKRKGVETMDLDSPSKSIKKTIGSHPVEIDDHEIDDQVVSHAEKKVFDEQIQSVVISPGICIASRKVPADIIESLIGAFFVEGGLSSAREFLKRLALMPKTEAQESDAKMDISSPIFDLCDVFHDGFTSGLIQQVEEKILGYKFNNKRFLIQAFTHPSWFEHGVSNYQRLEYLGDAVLDFVLISKLFNLHPEYSPAQLTEVKTYYVSNMHLGYCCVRTGLHKFLRHSSSALSTDITNFVELLDSFQIQHMYQQPDEFQAPKVLGDIVESLIGAVFVDSDQAWNKVERVIERICGQIPNIDSVPKNPVAQFYQHKTIQQARPKFMLVEQGDKYVLQLYLNGRLCEEIECDNQRQGKRQICTKVLQILDVEMEVD